MGRQMAPGSAVGGVKAAAEVVTAAAAGLNHCLRRGGESSAVCLFRRGLGKMEKLVGWYVHLAIGCFFGPPRTILGRGSKLLRYKLELTCWRRRGLRRVRLNKNGRHFKSEMASYILLCRLQPRTCIPKLISTRVSSPRCSSRFGVECRRRDRSLLVSLVLVFPLPSLPPPAHYLSHHSLSSPPPSGCEGL